MNEYLSSLTLLFRLGLLSFSVLLLVNYLSFAGTRSHSSPSNIYSSWQLWSVCFYTIASSWILGVRWSYKLIWFTSALLSNCSCSAFKFPAALLAAMTLSLASRLTNLQIIAFGLLDAKRDGTRCAVSISLIETPSTPSAVNNLIHRSAVCWAVSLSATAGTPTILMLYW